MKRKILPRKTANDFELFNLSVWYCAEDNQFYWDEDCIDTTLLIKNFKEKVLRTPLPFILRAIIKRLQEHTNDTHKDTQDLLNRLIA
jgi:hypothetical protein